MANVTFKGNPVRTVGNLPSVGYPLPAFKLVKSDLSEISLSDFQGKSIIFNIFPSIDTAVCATSVRTFNAKASQLPNTVVLCVSMDLPFAQSRFCGAEGLTNVVTASAFRHRDFEQRFGVGIADGPLAGLLSRAVVVTDPTGKVVYTEQVGELTHEPDYERALKAIQQTAGV